MIIPSLLLILLSAALLAEAVFRFFRSRNGRLTRRLVRFTASLILAILALEGAYACQSGHPRLSATLFTDILQAFSLDADYGAVAARTWPAFSAPWFCRALSVYSIVLYSLAPIAGGAVIYDILAGVSPAIKLAFCKRRRLYVFSELNERTVLLAESIASRKQGRKDFALVFTDVYVSSDEDENELLLRAKALGAVCLQDDMLSCTSFRASRESYFFLMDLDGSQFDDRSNVAAVYQMLDVSPEKPPIWKVRQGCRIILFSNDSGAVENVRSIKKTFDAANVPQDKTAVKPYGDVSVSVIRDDALTASLLLHDRPLFLPLGAPQPGAVRPLRVAIFGDSGFARELFKAVFWFGQLLDVQLCITVVSDPAAARAAGRQSFQSYLDQFSPEITDSCVADRLTDTLRIRPGDDEAAPPYALLSFIDTDIRAEPLRAFLDRDDRTYQHSGGTRYRLADCDYFFIAGESDTQNIDLASELCSSLLYLHESSRRAGRPAPIIAPMVQDDALARIIRDRFQDTRSSQRRIHGFEPPELCPFGSLKDRYSYEQVFYSDDQLAKTGHSLDARASEHAFADITANGDDIYSNWSSTARQFHVPYKMYCAGCYGGHPIEDALQYRRILADDKTLFIRLTWLEHRRWNAFLRAQGFTRPSFSMQALDRTFGPVMPALLRADTNEEVRNVLLAVTIPPSLAVPGAEGQAQRLSRLTGFKDVQAKLQPCLVESAPDVIQDPDRYDMLDLITAARLYINLIDSFKADEWEGKKAKKRSDVKTYDKPGRDQLPALEPHAVLRWMQQTGQAGQDSFSLRTEADVDKAWASLLGSDTPLGRLLAAYEKDRK